VNTEKNKELAISSAKRQGKWGREENWTFDDINLFRAATKCSQFEVFLLANCKIFRYAAGQSPLHLSCFCWQIANLSLRGGPTYT
jgi:hypothetical protein